MWRCLVAGTHVTGDQVDGPTCRAGGVRYSVARAGREDQWGRHQELAGEELGKTFTVNRGVVDIVLGVEGRFVDIEDPVTDFVRGGVSLHRGTSLRGQHDSAVTLWQDRSEQAVERVEHEAES